MEGLKVEIVYINEEKKSILPIDLSLTNDEYAGMGTTVVMATHAKDIVDKMKKRVIQIDKGIIIRDDKKGGYDFEV